MDKDREKKDKERDKKVEEKIEKLEKDRDKEKDEKEKKLELLEKTSEGSVLPPKLLMNEKKDPFQSQRLRLRDLFIQIEKEFELLWEENQELRKRLDNKKLNNKIQLSRKESQGFSARLNPLKKKEKEANEWERLTHFLGHRDGIWEVSRCTWEKYSTNSFATASADRTARVWSSDASSPVYIYVGHKGSVNSVRFHPLNRILCTASGDYTCHIWRLPKIDEKLKQEEKKLKQEEKIDQNQQPWTPLLQRGESSELTSIQNRSTPSHSNLDITPNNVPPPPPPLDISDKNPDGYQYNVITITRSISELKHQGVVIAADWIFSGEKIVTASWDHKIKYWNLENAKCIQELDAGFEISSNHYMTNITTHPSSSLALTSASDNCFRLWDFRSDQPLIFTNQGHTDIVTSACFISSDDNIIVSSSDDRTVKIWDKRKMKESKHTIRCSAGVNKVGISPVLPTLLAIPTDDVKVKVCDLSGKLFGRLKSEEKNGHKLMVTSTAWSSDGSVIFTASFDRSVIAWGKPSRPKTPQNNI